MSPFFNMKYIFKGSIFYCHVSLLEGKSSPTPVTSTTLRRELKSEGRVKPSRFASGSSSNLTGETLGGFNLMKDEGCCCLFFCCGKKERKKMKKVDTNLICFFGLKKACGICHVLGKLAPIFLSGYWCRLLCMCHPITNDPGRKAESNPHDIQQANQKQHLVVVNLCRT